MAYVDGFVVAVPRDKLDAYKELSRLGGTVWREHGALSFVECVEDDVKPGKLTSFPQAVKLEEGEVCVLVDHVRVAGSARRHQRQGHAGPAPGQHDGS